MWAWRLGSSPRLPPGTPAPARAWPGPEPGLARHCPRPISVSGPRPGQPSVSTLRPEAGLHYRARTTGQPIPKPHTVPPAGSMGSEGPGPAPADHEIAERLLDFMNASHTQFHAVAEAAKRLDAAGFLQLKEREAWDDLRPGARYYFTRNDSSLVAFAVGERFQPGNGFYIIGAHTDRCLRGMALDQASGWGGECRATGTQAWGMPLLRRSVSRGRRAGCSPCLPSPEGAALSRLLPCLHNGALPRPWARSPCFKLKPVTRGVKSGYAMVNVEPYGGLLEHTWFDRDLSLAGRVLVRTDGGLEHQLVRCRRRATRGRGPGPVAPAARVPEREPSKALGVWGGVPH